MRKILKNENISNSTVIQSENMQMDINFYQNANVSNFDVEMLRLVEKGEFLERVDGEDASDTLQNLKDRGLIRYEGVICDQGVFVKGISLTLEAKSILGKL